MIGEYFNTKEVAQYLRIARRTLWKLLRSGRLKGKKENHNYYIHKSAIDAYVKSLTLDNYV